MTIDVRTEHGIAVVSLKGDVDLQFSPKLRKKLLELLAEKRNLLVDLGHVRYIDSSGVASLVEAFQLARKHGTRFGLVGVSSAAMRVLQLARLDRVFSIFPSMDDALRAEGGST